MIDILQGASIVGLIMLASAILMVIVIFAGKKQ